MYERFNVAQTNLTMRRSRFIERVPVYQHAFHGDLCVDLILEMLPGDNLKAKIHDYTRMSVPIAPIMGNIRKHFVAMNCPKRIIWNKTKQFYGEAETFGIAEEVVEPHFTMCNFLDSDGSSEHNIPFLVDYDFIVDKDDDPTNTKTNFELLCGINPWRTFSTFMNLIAYNGNSWDDLDSSKLVGINVLPLWAVLKCYNEHFRDQNFCLPYQWDMDLEGEISTYLTSIATLGLLPVSYCSPLPKVRKDNDMFVSFLPWAQKGDPVSLPLGDTAQLISLDDTKSDLLAFNKSTNSFQALSSEDLEAPSGLYQKGSSKAITIDSNGYLVPRISSNVVADLTSATAVTISQLLYAVAYQDFLQRLCKFGSRYGDYIKAIFGVSTDDATQDIPEFLGYRSMLLNIDTVVQTTDHEASENTKLGDLGGYSATRIDDSGEDYYVNYGCKEPGYVIFFSYFKHERVYASGIDDIYLKKELLDYYQSPFANISDTPYPKALIHFTGDSSVDLESFGFNEPFLGYRNHRPQAKGFLNPNLPGSLEYWVLADKYDNTPILGADFVEEDRNAIARALTSGEAGPDYICNTDYELDWVRVMPLYSSGRIGNF